jgi:hypothetical protein
MSSPEILVVVALVLDLSVLLLLPSLGARGPDPATRAQAYCANPGPSVAHRALFDSDSFDILVDGGATASISNCLDNFIQPPTTTNIRIKGFNGTYSAATIGTVRWPILDDRESSMCSRYLILTLWLSAP